MGYSVHFKDASLRQIFTLKASQYAQDCHAKVCDVIHNETPDVVIARISGRPHSWVIKSDLTESMKAKIMELPFVDKIQTDDETRVRNKQPEPIKEKMRHFIQGAIYRD